MTALRKITIIDLSGGVSVCMYSCIYTYVHHTWPIVIVKTLYTPPAQFTTHPGQEVWTLHFHSWLLVWLQRTRIVSLSWLFHWRDAKFRNRMSRRPQKGSLNNRRSYNECFSPATFPVTSLARRPATRVTPESRLVLRRQGCGFCGATTVRKQGPLLSRVFSHRASNHDNSPAEKHPSNPCLLARRHN